MPDRLFVVTSSDMKKLVKDASEKIKANDLIWVAAQEEEGNVVKELQLPDNIYNTIYYKNQDNMVDELCDLITANAKNIKVYLIGDRLRPLWEKYREQIAFHCEKGCGFHENFSVGRLSQGNFLSLQKKTSAKPKTLDGQMSIFGSDVVSMLITNTMLAMDQSENEKKNNILENPSPENKSNAEDTHIQKLKTSKKRDHFSPTVGQFKKEHPGKKKTEPGSVSAPSEKPNSNERKKDALKSSVTSMSGSKAGPASVMKTESVSDLIKAADNKLTDNDFTSQEIYDRVETTTDNSKKLNIDIAKSVISTYMNNRLLRHIRIFCGEQYRWLMEVDDFQYEEYAADLILMLLKAKNECDFNESWAMTHQMAPLTLSPELYRMFKKEALHYKETMAELYDRDSEFDDL